MDISSFKIEQAVLEWRYENAYALWDRAGLIWTDAVAHWPALVMESAKPNEISFTKDRRFDYKVEISQTRIIEHYPKNDISLFLEECPILFNITRERLELTDLTRIGFRIMFFREYPTREEASKDLMSIGLLNAPKGKFFNIDGKMRDGGFNYRFEDDELGALISFRVYQRKIELTPPPGTPEIKPISVEKSGILFDVDYYTRSQVAANGFSPKPWVEQVHHMIRRDSKAFLGGK